MCRPYFLTLLTYVEKQGSSSTSKCNQSIAIIRLDINGDCVVIKYIVRTTKYNYAGFKYYSTDNEGGELEVAFFFKFA